MDPQGCVQLVQQQLESGRSAKAITNRLLNEAVIERRCKDNCSVMLIVLTSLGKQQQQQQQHEENCAAVDGAGAVATGS